MRIYLRHVEPYGFVGGDFWASRFHWLYHRKCPVTKTVTVISNYCPEYVAQYQLTNEQYKAFDKGKLGITPPGCCNAHGRESIEEAPETIIRKEIKTMKELDVLLQFLGCTKKPTPKKSKVTV